MHPVNDSLSSSYSRLTHLIVRIMKRCNLPCRMCDFWKTKDVGFDLAFFERLCQQARTLGVKEIQLTGGEPTIHSSFFEIMKVIQSYGIQRSMITNGTWFEDPQFLKMVGVLNLERMHISLDGDAVWHDYERRSKGLWKKVSRGLIQLSTLKQDGAPEIVLNYIVSCHTYKALPSVLDTLGPSIDAVQLLPIKGEKEWYLSRDQIKEWNELVAPIVEEKCHRLRIANYSGLSIFGTTEGHLEQAAVGNYNFSPHPCFVAQKTLFIDELGNAFPCANTPYTGSDLILGNVLIQSLEEILNSRKRKESICTLPSPEHCSGCMPSYQFINTEAFKRGIRF